MAEAKASAQFKFRVTAGSVGPWKQGEIISQADIDKQPQFGGVARLRDEQHAIEDYFEAPPPHPTMPLPTVVKGTGPNA